MRRLVIVPDGWETTIERCRPGFFVHGNMLGYKTEYSVHASSTCTTGGAFNSGGEYFHTPARQDTMVQPVTAVWEEDDEEP